MIEIGQGELRISIHEPDAADGYYRGTRFDWAGVFEGVRYRGCNYAEPWFESYSPIMHDAVCGPAEEFGPVGVDDAAPGQPFLKIGVGILEKMDEPVYDRFKLHKILDYGRREQSVTDDSVVFRHVIESTMGYGYDYIKEIVITGDDTFRIRHRLSNTGALPIKTDFYNHNFFTLGLLSVGSGRCLDFPYIPEGDWRDVNDHVALTDGGIRFNAPNDKVRSVFIGNLHEKGHGSSGSPSSFDVYEKSTGRGVKVRCTLPMTYAVFWANPRIACVEPYLDIDIRPGESFDFSIDYILESDQK